MLETAFDIVNSVNDLGKEYLGLIVVIIAVCQVVPPLRRPAAQSRFANSYGQKAFTTCPPSLKESSFNPNNARISDRSDLSGIDFGQNPGPSPRPSTLGQFQLEPYSIARDKSDFLRKDSY